MASLISMSMPSTMICICMYVYFTLVMQEPSLIRWIMGESEVDMDQMERISALALIVIKVKYLTCKVGKVRYLR